MDGVLSLRIAHPVPTNLHVGRLAIVARVRAGLVVAAKGARHLIVRLALYGGVMLIRVMH